MLYAFYSPDSGDIIRLDTRTSPPEEGGFFVEVPASTTWINSTERKKWRIVDGTPTPVDLRSFSEIKNDAWNEIKRAREQEEFGGFTYNNMVFDSDTVSQGRIQGAVILAMQNPAFTVVWTLQDNSSVMLSATDLEGVGQALAQHVATAHAHSQALRNQIESATTIAEVEAVVW